MRSRPLFDVAALLARLGAGVVFMAHGWQKIEAGITATGRSFDALGVPLPTGAAVYAAFVELLGGAALIAGLGLPVVGVLLFVDMAGAFVFVHAGEGLFLVDGGTARNGYELVLVLGLTSLLFAAGAGGRLTLDRWLLAGRPRRSSGDGGDDDEEEDEQSFVASLREPEAPGAPGALTKPKPEPKAPAPKPPAPPESAVRPERKPRLATDIVEGEADDTLVAGRRKPGRRRRTDDTRPIRREGDQGPGRKGAAGKDGKGADGKGADGKDA
ncbi:DoxX family protein [Spirillospora sp. NPDC029432]|uniref:DoxX family protein n=1 Tax=Spirillospora sp. NPDC029432 TaxID=3154599 RepID=UPI00345117BF